MDKENRKKTNILEGAIASFKAEAARRKSERGALVCDLIAFISAFFFARRHIVFGAYPLASALISVLPSRVWISAAGAVAGSLSLGKSGVIHAITTLLILFLRIIISSGRIGGEKESLFSEPLIMRFCAGTIGAFVSAGYEILLSGFSFTSILFGVSGVLATLFFSVVFSGLFITDIAAEELLFTDRTIFRKKRDKEDSSLILFQLSASVTIFLFTLSLKEYDYFGISIAYIFSVALTLYVSKRFGALRGMATGFVSTAAVSALLSPGAALLGALSALLYPFGIGYAIVGGGAAFFVWSAYAQGIGGLLSVLSEYMIASLLISGALRRAPTEKEEQVRASLIATAEEMVGASWLSEKAESSSMTALEQSVSLAADRIKELSREDSSRDFEDYRDICIKILSEEKLPQNREIINIIASKLYKKQKIDDKELEEFEEHGIPKYAAKKILAEAAEHEKFLYGRKKSRLYSEQYELLSKMINEARRREVRERSINEQLSEKAKEVFSLHGFAEGSIKVFGDERIRVIGAGLDKDGTLITSPDLKLSLEEALGVRLSSYEYFRRGDMALFKAKSAAAFSVKYAMARKSGRTGEISGDSARFFGTETEFFAIISDGMGSGKEAREGADFATSYLSEMLTGEVSPQTAISALSSILRSRDGEGTASIDLFSVDLTRGDGTFIKCGAVPSYIKRGKSIFRMRSESAPIGLLSAVDAEKIRVEIKSGDLVVMLSDGVAASVEDSAWLLSFMSDNEPSDLDSYANEILSRAALRNSQDDMTVCVLRILSK